MKLEEILEEIEKDSDIDMSRLDHESIQIPKLHSKYLKLLAQEKRAATLLRTQLIPLYREKSEYYDGKAAPEVYRDKPFNQKLTKSQVEKYVESDPDIVRLTSGIEQQQEKVDVLHEQIKSINQRSFNIKNAVEWHRFTNGG